MFTKPRENIYLSKYNKKFGVFIHQINYLSMVHYIPCCFLQDKSREDTIKFIIKVLEHREGIKLSTDQDILDGNSYHERYFA